VDGVGTEMERNMGSQSKIRGGTEKKYRDGDLHTHAALHQQTEGVQ